MSELSKHRARASVPSAGEFRDAMRTPASAAAIYRMLDDLLELARPNYEEAKIKHNLLRTPESLAWLEEQRKALESLEAFAARGRQ